MRKSDVETIEAVPSVTEDTAVSEPAVTIYPLPVSTMDALDNATIAISLKEDDAYVDDTALCGWM